MEREKNRRSICGSRQRYSRRQFIARAAMAGIVTGSPRSQAPAATETSRNSLPDAISNSAALDGLRKAFLTPPQSAKPLTRWFWFGGAITPEEITRELTFMRDAGIGGVELQPLYPLEVDDPQRGIRNIRYFSPEWFDLLRHTVKETKRLGLQFDLTLGSGWPYGGPFIPEALAARRLRILTQNFGGPGEFSWDFSSQVLWEYDRDIVAVLAAPILQSGQPDIGKVVNISDRVKPVMRLGSVFGYEVRWTTPPGLWIIMLFMNSPNHMQVKRPTLGMEGYVVDYLSRKAVELFLSAAGTRVVNELKSVADLPINSVFSDSLEVFGADWTGDFLKEFQERRGYDLTPYLPALWTESGPLTPHVRYDFHLTLSDLILDNFFRVLVEWAEQRSMKTRVQAHGVFGDSMRACGLVHIPEGEAFGSYRPIESYYVDLKNRRLATSAAHIYQKAVISAETYTHLRPRFFRETLEALKAAADSMFLDGINLIVNSGYPSSPPQAGQPGWTFYAPTVINHNVTWWRHYPHVARTIQRTQSMLMQGVSVNPIVFYIPQADVFSKVAAGGSFIEIEMEELLGQERFLQLRHAGYDFDLINDHALEHLSRADGGKLVAGSAIYSVAVVPNVQFMPVESLERLVAFARAGGTLIFIGRLPEMAPGILQQDSRSLRLRALLKEIWGGSDPSMGEPVRFGTGQVVLVADYAAVLAYIQQVLMADFRIVKAGNGSESAQKLATENVGFVRRRLGPLDLYFLANISEHLQDLRVRFSVGHRVPERWNPGTGSVEETLVFEYVELGGGKDKATEVQLRLEPFESCFVIFSASKHQPLVSRTNWTGPLKIESTSGNIQVSGLLPAKGEYFLATSRRKSHRFSVASLPHSIRVEGPWELQLEGGQTLQMSQLRSWTELEQTKSYSGWATYETTFPMGDFDKDIEWILDLGRVHETAEVTLNQVSLGAAWKGWRRLSCLDALQAGQNRLKVEVANLWINKFVTLPRRDLKPIAETFGIRWTVGRVADTVPPAGLLGPVQLVPLRRYSARFKA
jgi:hypothetical protein